MDLRLVICFAVIAFAAVEATSVIGPKCARHCEYGFYPGSCRCRQFPVEPANPCAVRFCPINTRCEARGPVAVCVPVPVLPVDVCRQPKETGPCKAYMPRYYYNSLSRQCERFIYGGCLGNENNFQILRECDSRCRRQNSYY